VLSCSKKDDNNSINEEDIVAKWTISERPVFSVTISSSSEYKQYEQKIVDTLTYLFHENDQYDLKEDGKCVVTRNGNPAPYPESYRIDGNYLIFDNYIKFQTNESANKLTLTAGDNEIKEIVKVELKKPKYGYNDDTINSILKFVSGNVKLVLTK
jgi:hypothetical protein